MLTIGTTNRVRYYFAACPCGRSAKPGLMAHSSTPDRYFTPKNDGVADCAKCDDYGWLPFEFPPRRLPS